MPIFKILQKNNKLFLSSYNINNYSNAKSNKKLTLHNYIKTKVDNALRKVLGLEIFYTKKEIANNIKAIFDRIFMK